MHLGEKPLACDDPDCGQRFAQQSAKNQHYKALDRFGVPLKELQDLPKEENDLAVKILLLSQKEYNRFRAGESNIHQQETQTMLQHV